MRAKRTRPKPTRKQLLLVAGVSLLAAAVLFLLLRPRSLHEHAENALEAVLEQDARTLHGYIFERERAMFGLTPEKTRRVLEEVVFPNLGTLRPQGGIRTETASETGDRVFAVTTVEAGRHPLRFSLTATLTEEGPCTGLTDLISKSWWVRYVREGGDPESPNGLVNAVLHGISRDSAKLQALGITHRVYEDPVKPNLTWQEFEARYRQLAASR